MSETTAGAIYPVDDVKRFIVEARNTTSAWQLLRGLSI